MALAAQDVMVVPAAKRLALLRQPEDTFIQSEDCDEWERPAQKEDSLMIDYLNDNYGGAPKRFWAVRVGTRVGYNSEGVFLHENHQKRYFGLEKAKTSASLQDGVADAVPLVNAKGEQLRPGTHTEQVLGKMIRSLPTLTDDMRYQVLHASFQRADRNGNGKLSRPELGQVLRRVLNTLRSTDIDEILKDADTNNDGQINYQEFVSWLQRTANSKFNKAFGSSLRDEADIVRATFRLWDTNGDGLVSNRHLCRALVKVHPDLAESQINALVKVIDCDHDGNVDYDEFVDFLFHRAERPLV